ncbi:putative colanic acid biosynthesis acetyltransferase [Mycetocola manganoxydans]|uniref:Putative colanic acid biosynthesis acetyltransferase n=1 Tax=Mycetocola manganoxydans TaxID=699879 RepID=A0A3L6ZLE3_9MICO|nr:putative colanic acid biosynthesis acetyltransferase [Mycetocola manganoxydans]RLP68677.1 putative colanic acid biosynthesis acetyltransferase [Mycetocola manganoxydans]
MTSLPDRTPTAPTARTGPPHDFAASRRRLAGFTGAGYDRGRNTIWQIGWMLTSGLITSRWWCPPSIRAAILRGFGATIGRGVNIRHGVRIHWPWKLTVGHNSWIGEQTWILNLEPVTIGDDVCISQDVFLCTGSHDRHSPTFEFDNAPIVVQDGAWVAARATILRGTVVGRDSVIGATALVRGNVAPGSVILGAAATNHSPSGRPA